MAQVQQDSKHRFPSELDAAIIPVDTLVLRQPEPACGVLRLSASSCLIRTARSGEVWMPSRGRACSKTYKLSCMRKLNSEGSILLTQLLQDMSTWEPTVQTCNSTCIKPLCCVLCSRDVHEIPQQSLRVCKSICTVSTLETHVAAMYRASRVQASLSDLHVA